jgi:hypothetical protein
MSNKELTGYQPLRARTIGDRNYELASRGVYSCCGNAVFEIWRWSGASISRYRLPEHFDSDDFDDFVETLDEQFLQTSDKILVEFYEKLQEKNSKEGIDADFSYEFRLLEYGRQRALALQKLDYLPVLLSDKTPVENDKIAVRLAFELGFATSEHRLMVIYEDYVHDGVAMSEWRKAGLPLARGERLRQGARTRKEILAAAEKLYAADASLIRNDSETAKRILEMRLPALQKGANQQLSLDAVTRHLRAGRRKQATPEN